MKIGLVRRGYSPTGGAENYLGRLADALEGAGHEPVLFATPDWPRDRWPAHRGRVAIERGSPRAFADRVARLSEKHCERLFSLERLWRCDCYRAGDGVHGAWLERRAAFAPGWQNLFRRWNPKHLQILALEKSLFAGGGARSIIANSKLVREEITQFYGTPPERIAVIYNGLPAECFQPVEPGTRERERQARGLAPEDYAILFAGTGWERKGLAHAVAAVKRLPGSLRARLLVAGRGNPPSSWCEHARFLGPVADMRSLYAAADVFVAPTLYDPFSNACLEALASGLPILTTPANGCAEIIAPGVEGDVFPVEDHASGETLAALMTAWADPERRAAARPTCAAKATRFTIEKNVGETLDVLLGGG